MTQVTTNSLGIIQWDAIPSETGYIGAGNKNAWKGPEICMWRGHFVCAGPGGWHPWLHVLFEQDRTSWWQHRGEEYVYNHCAFWKHGTQCH